MNNISYKIRRHNRAFSLAEVLAALTIGAMVLVAVLGIYRRAETSAAAITRRFDSSRLPSEILQRIAEDLDRIIASGSDTKITIENKLDNLHPTARLKILKTVYDSKNVPQKFEEIIWQTSYDYESDANGLVLYRSHSGIRLEDRLLDEYKDTWEQELFVPICTGVTFFKIQALLGEKPLDGWTRDKLPNGIVATISFAEPFKTVAGPLDVLDEEKIARTIAVDRSRKIKFVFVEKEYDYEYDEQDEEGEETKEKEEKEEDKKNRKNRKNR